MTYFLKKPMILKSSTQVLILIDVIQTLNFKKIDVIQTRSHITRMSYTTLTR